jgi:hypothetical protein
MTIDNISLEKRLNLVTQELDRILIQRDEFRKNLNVFEYEINKLTNIIN